MSLSSLKAIDGKTGIARLATEFENVLISFKELSPAHVKASVCRVESVTYVNRLTGTARGVMIANVGVQVN